MALRILLTNSRSNTFDTPDVCYVIFGCCYEEVSFCVFLPLWQGSSLDSTLFLTDASRHRLDLFCWNCKDLHCTVSPHVQRGKTFLVLKLEPVVLNLATSFPHSALTLMDNVPNTVQLLVSLHYRIIC